VATRQVRVSNKHFKRLPENGCHCSALTVFHGRSSLTTDGREFIAIFPKPSIPRQECTAVVETIAMSMLAKINP
jgi:hypothetical protein